MCESEEMIGFLIKVLVTGFMLLVSPMLVRVRDYE